MRFRSRHPFEDIASVLDLVRRLAGAVLTIGINTGKRLIPNMAGKYGTEAITKSVQTFAKVAQKVRAVGEDGWQVTDAGLIIRDGELMNEVADLLGLLNQIGPEAADLDFMEIMNLAGTLVPLLADLVPKKA
jgi:hypothetical protein